MSEVRSAVADDDQRGSDWPRVGWGIFLVLIVSAAAVSVGASANAAVLLVSTVAVLLAWRFPLVAFYASLATAPLLGILFSASTGALSFGDRVFGGSVDVTIGDAIVGAVLVAWAIHALTSWRARQGWRPWLPLLGPYLLLIVAHVVSVFSHAQPDPLLVLKYSFRPVLFVYVASVLLPVNFLRAKRQLAAAFFLLAAVGLFFAFDGFRSLFSFTPGQSLLHFAHPLNILEVSPLGGNHNALAELMLFAAPLALAWSVFARDIRWKRLAIAAAIFMSAIGLLTFARSAWIALACETAFLSATIWRGWIKRRIRLITALTLLCAPLFVYMAIFSIQPGTRSSTDARVMMSSVAWDLFRGSPVVGVGAGQFMDRLGRVEAYTVEFGDPIEAHGMIQKLLAETGFLGFAAFLFVLWVLARELLAVRKLLKRGSEEDTVFAFLLAAVIGAFVYQLFDTTYWTSRLWLPVGLALAAAHVFLRRRVERDPDFLM